MSKKQILTGVVVGQEEVAQGTFVLTLKEPHLARLVKPGHFVNLSLPGRTTANLLKRPFCIFGAHQETIQLLYKIKGDVTTSMMALHKGDEVELIGPLGNTFSHPKNKKILMVGGGVGIAPLMFLYDRLSEQNEIKILHGVRTRQESMVWAGHPIQTHVDEEVGKFVCEGIDKLIKQHGIQHVVSCGPIPMMKQVVEACKALNVSVEVSLEARMACGFGVCLGCVIETHGGYKKVCNDGPVFKGTDLW